MSFEIRSVEKNTLSDLKDFQKATVNRLDYLYRHGQSRVLVADEVGMGKTLVARGAIVKAAKIGLEENKNLFRVVYVCSNQIIARQNLQKLDVNNSVTKDSISDTRLSMQHLRITEQSNDPTVIENYIQLIPLTPETSFRMTSGGGNINERALIYAILRRMVFLRTYLAELDELLAYNTSKLSWEQKKEEFEERVLNCKKITNGIYPSNIIDLIDEYDKEYKIKDFIISQLRLVRSGAQDRKDGIAINTIRVMFARISASLLQPDFVIMDEFQRFKYLLSTDIESDLGILIHNFFDNENTKILLLSATPYKLYSTLEEIDENDQVDEHYEEFYQVIDFLFRNKETSFREVWSDYSNALKETQRGNFAILQAKEKAEDVMYSAVCRTERISVMESGDYTDDSGIVKMQVTEDDIKSYLQMAKLLDDCNAEFSLPIDYVKSAPYLMSFMNKYKVKEYLQKYFKQNPHELNKANRNELWLERSKIDQYKELPKTNARFELLKNKAFEGHSEMYLWVPPSKPYYPLQGVYKSSDHFSKILVFSAWEMVPRMIGVMLSYEAERKTLGRLYQQEKNIDRKNTHYFADGNKRYPPARMQFVYSNSKARNMNLFSLIYPSKTLANLYNPVDCLNRGLSLQQIEKEIKLQIKGLVTKLNKYVDTSNNRVDEKWYYLAPMLLDGLEYAKQWIKDSKFDSYSIDSLGDIASNNVRLYLYDLDKVIATLECNKLGKMPSDLVDVLANEVLGSPAVCISRKGLEPNWATILACLFISYFNSTESTAIVELAYGRTKSDDSHWQNVLRYCKDGCFQSMFDEYYHVLSSNVGFSDANKNLKIYEAMKSAIDINVATYPVDTFNSFKSSIVNGDEKRIRMRSSYAVGFTKDVTDKESNVNRKDNIRNSFNSPLRPFVLATTSIGQEGLDFHLYCRKIMHWNLPSNPIDLEQREGRVNRYKCLAIRQNVADDYGKMQFSSDDVWEDMFAAAEKGERDENQCELIPYWCFGKNQKVKIERIIPMYPISKDEINYERMIKILSLYRLTLGQARQEEVLEYIFNNVEDTDKLKELFIDLSPISKGVKKKVCK